MESRRDVDEEEIRPPEEHPKEEVPKGWRPSQETVAAIGGQTDTASTSQDYPVQGDAKERENLSAGFVQLESTDTGKPIAQAIRDTGKPVKFGQTGEDAIAETDPSTKEITINERYKDASPAVLAAYLAHEGTHVQSGTPTSATDALDQEYRCFKAQTEVWNAVKGSDEQDPDLDYDAAVIARSEADAKADIRRRYGDEYFTRWGGKL